MTCDTCGREWSHSDLIRSCVQCQENVGIVIADLERRIARALDCLGPVYRLLQEDSDRRWWQRKRQIPLGVVVLAERVRRALTEDAP